VTSADPRPDPAPTTPQSEPARIGKVDPKRRVWAAEAIGLVIITLLIVVYALLRYGRTIPWNAR
jgi:hypothetical protein